MRKLLLLTLFLFSTIIVHGQKVVVDTAFKPQFTYPNYLSSIREQPDGKILITTWRYNNRNDTNRLFRLFPDGRIDSSFNNGKIFVSFNWRNHIGFNSSSYYNNSAMAFQKDEKIIIGGSFDTCEQKYHGGIVRLNKDGSIDNTFKTGTGFSNDSLDSIFKIKYNNYYYYNNLVRCLVIDDQGRILVGGEFSKYNGVPKNGIIRLNKDGSIDETFKIGSGFTAKDSTYYWSYGYWSILNTMIIQPDKKILIQGSFDRYNGKFYPGIVRLNADGSVDDSFKVIDSSAAAKKFFYDYWSNNKVCLRDNGDILVIENRFRYSTNRLQNLVQLKSDGKLDKNFQNINYNKQNSSFIFSILVRRDNQILTSGTFSPYDTNRCNYFYFLNDNGSENKTIKFGKGFNSEVYNMDIQKDKKVLVTGIFRVFNKDSVPGITRLVFYETDVLNLPKVLCKGESYMLPFAMSGYYDSTNTINVELSDETGSFTNPRIIGTKQTKLSDSVLVTIPDNLPAGVGYKIRVVPSNSIFEIAGAYEYAVELVEKVQPIISEIKPICKNATGNYQVQAENGVIYEWSAKGGALVGANNSDVAVINWGNSDTAKITLKATKLKTNCTTIVDINVTLLALPETEIVGTDTVCNTVKYDYVSNSKKDLTYSWKVIGGSLIGSEKDKNIGVVWDSVSTGKVVLSVIDNKTLCANTFEKNIVVRIVPPVNIAASSYYCSGDTIEIQANQSANLSYEWKTVGGEVIGDPFGNKVKIAVGASNNLEVNLLERNIYTSCENTIKSIIPILTNAVQSISGPDSSNIDFIENYSIISNPDYEYSWSADGGEVVGDNNIQNAKIKWLSQINCKVILKATNKITGCVSFTEKSVKVNILHAEISVAPLVKKSGEIFNLELLMNNSKNIDLTRTTGFEAVIKYNKTLMAPLNKDLNHIEKIELQYVTLKGDLKATQGAIGSFAFIAALGNDSCTTIEIDNIKWTGVNIPSVLIPSSLCISDICKTCGVRLVNPAGKLDLDGIKVIGAYESVILDIKYSNNKPKTIRLVNILGECIISREIWNEQDNTKQEILDLTGVSSGVYFITLSDEDSSVTKMISIER